ncbi:hypothetical protein [Oceanobacillus sp. HCA-5259]|uniref:hypothetical protein n=1 Tax=Oceanobacillus sp. HCA-5259 TaxID=3134661 RepID=UPI0030ECA633
MFVDLFIIGPFLFRKKPDLAVPKQRKRKYVVASSFLIILTICLGLVKSVHIFSESYDREQMVKSIGLLNYHLYDIVLSIKAPLQPLIVTEADADVLEAYTQPKSSERKDLFGIAEGKNIILITLESTRNFVINH